MGLGVESLLVGVSVYESGGCRAPTVRRLLVVLVVSGAFDTQTCSRGALRCLAYYNIS